MNLRLMIDSGWVASREALTGALAAAWLCSTVTMRAETSVPALPLPATAPPPVAASAAKAPPPAIRARPQVEIASHARAELSFMEFPSRPSAACRSRRTDAGALFPGVCDVGVTIVRRLDENSSGALGEVMPRRHKPGP